METGNEYASASITKFAAAFVKAQAEIKGATKDKTNTFFNNTKYADLASVMDACKDSLNKHGIAIIQSPASAPAGRLALKTILMHESGEWVAGTGEMPVGKDGPQAFGSALTYARRYFLAAMVGVCPEDDDAESASGRGNQQQRPVQRPAPAQKATMPDAAEQFSIQVDDAFDARETAGQVGDPEFLFTRDDRRKICTAVAKKSKVASVADLTPERRMELLNKIVAGAFDEFRAAAKELARA